MGDQQSTLTAPWPTTPRCRAHHRNSSSLSDEQGCHQEVGRKQAGSSQHLTLSIDNWYLVQYNDCLYVGKVVDIDDDEYKILMFKRTGNNKFTNPLRPDKVWYDRKDIVMVISLPQQVSR